MLCFSIHSKIGISIGSLFSFFDAIAAYINISSGFVKANGSPTVILFCVSVPVLSEHKISIPANSSIAASLLTIACFLARFKAPTAITTVKTVGSATGIAATVKISENSKSSNIFSCLFTP